jgi:hypothetical protein
MGFVLFKKTVRSRNLILGKSRLASTATASTKTGH